MKTINFNINSAIIRIISGTALATIILAGTGYAQTVIIAAKTTEHDLAHYMKVAGKDTAHTVDRGTIKTAVVADRTGKDTGQGVKKGFAGFDKILNRGGRDAGRATMVSARATGRFFRRVGRAVV